MNRTFAAAMPLAAALCLTALPAAAQDAEEGMMAFNNHCRTCHVTAEGDNRLGPSLHNIVGREAGTGADFGYSSAMRNASHTWDAETLDRFIENPDSVVPGHNMEPFSGVSDPAERANIIAYLESESAGGDAGAAEDEETDG